MPVSLAGHWVLKGLPLSTVQGQVVLGAHSRDGRGSGGQPSTPVSALRSARPLGEI